MILCIDITIWHRNADIPYFVEHNIYVPITYFHPRNGYNHEGMPEELKGKHRMTSYLPDEVTELIN